MTRLPRQRDTHLTPDEIAAEALRQFDAGTEPSIRGLAESLQVAPSAIYHHFASRSAIVQAAVGKAWGEATGELLELIPEPFAADPGDVLVATGVATRRTWYRHAHLAPHMAASPEADDFTANALALMANLFERLGLEGEEAAACFHTYASFMIGSALFTAARKVADEQLGTDQEDGRVYLAEADLPTARKSSKETQRSLDEVMDLDEQRDENLFADGLRRLVESFRPGAPGA